jgi:hypothetical protein
MIPHMLTLRKLPNELALLALRSVIIIIITRWASKRQSHSMKYYDKDTLRHDSLTSLQASQ